MGYSHEVVNKVRVEFENKRKRASALSDRHTVEVSAKCPELLSVTHALSLTGLSVFKASLESKQNLEKKIAEIKKENMTLQAKKRELLVNAGFPEDYLDIKYECEKCNDTGYVGVNMCSCMKKALVREAYNSSGLGKVLTSQTFENFDVRYYSDESTDGNASPREQMASILEKAKLYVEDFGEDGREENLLFCGTTGLGKTHITTAIAKGVIDKGYDVVYDSAQNIMRAFEQQRFDHDETAHNNVNRYFDCDLLIVDDLGTEFRNTFTQSVLYNLLNTRINSGKCMIVSTNLNDTASILGTYEERIASRLIGSFRFLRFVGKDVRILKTQIAAKNKN